MTKKVNEVVAVNIENNSWSLTDCCGETAKNTHELKEGKL